MQPTQKSLDILRKVSETIETWHHHHHILYDIACEYPADYQSDDTVPGVRKAVDNIVKVLSGWEIIGTFKNTLGARGVFRDDKGNCFVIRKGV